MPRLASAALVAVLVSLVLAAPARAGTYTVHACGSDGVNRAFWAYANPGLRAFSNCPGVDYQGEGTGLVAGAERNANGGRLGLHASAWQIFEAPPGAGLQSISFRVSAGRASGCWSMGVWGWSGGAFHPGDHLWGYGSHCPTAGGGFSYFIGPVHLDLAGREKVRLGVRCDADGGCPTTSGVATWTSLKDVAVTVRDDSPPAVHPKGGALLGNGWHRGHETAWAGYTDNVGIRHIYGQLDGTTFGLHDFTAAGWPDHVRCDYARPRPCADIGDGAVGVDTRTVPDGPHRLRLVAVDAAGNTAAHDRTIHVDNHPPAAPAAVVVAGGQDWRRTNRFDVTWQNPPRQVAPIVRAHWRLCHASGKAACRTGSARAPGVSRLDGVQVPESGDWTLAIWLEDEAGNSDARHVADPVHLRLDEVAPETPGFDAPDPADPRRLSLAVSDRHSGVAGARIELRPRGGGDWRELRTGLEPDGRAVAHVPDTELPDGAYEVRAFVRDHAGNETGVSTDRTGRAMTVVLPLRHVTRLAVGHDAARRCSTVRRRRRGRLVTARRCRRTTVAPAFAPVAALRVPFARGATVGGRLETWQGRPVGGATVEVHERLRSATEWRPLTTATTDPAGRFTLPLRAGASRTLRLAYPGDDLLLGSSLEATVLVPAAATLRVSRRRARNGGRVVFTGRLRGTPVPPGGRTVDLQAHYRGAWRTFATPRTDARGRWRHGYRFGATRGRVVYRFRAAVKREAAYPYEYGVTPTVRVTVTG